MARSYARSIQLTCKHCTAVRTAMWWGGDRGEEWNAATIRETCTACTNPDPHWEIGSSGGFSARTTSAKAVVYQLPDGDFMSVDTNTPEMVETAATAGVRREFGSVKELEAFCKERSRQKVERWKREMDEHYHETGEELYGVMTPTYQQWADLEYGGVRNDVIDFDEASIKEGRGHMQEEMALRRQQQEEKIKRFRPARDGSIRLPDGSKFRIGTPADNKRYERLRGRR